MGIDAGRFTILGPHENAPTVGLPIYLLPVGTKARGWGYEPDTRAALDWLAERVKPGMVVADIGTGTGILAIAAARLGGEVYAFEADDAIREIAAANFEANGLPIKLLGKYGGEHGFHVIVANLGDADDVYSKIVTLPAEVWTSG